MAQKKTPLQDLTPKSTGEGGRLGGNDNITLMRVAKPVVKKDLPAKKQVKGKKSI